MNMTHPDILQAELTGYPSRPKIETEPYLCDCGTQTISPINCTVCGHTGCRKCMVYDGEAAGDALPSPLPYSALRWP